MRPAPALLNHIGELLHNHYIMHRLAAGATPATNPVLVRFDALPEHLQQSNRDTAMQLWSRVQTFGFGLAPTDDLRPAVSEAEFLVHTEVLSELGHSRWMNNRLAQGWSYAPGPKNIDARTSPCLVGWDDLPLEEQEKERQQIRDLPGILRAVQLKIVRSRRLVPRPDDLEDAEQDWVQAATLQESQEGQMIEAIILEPTAEMLEAVGQGLHAQYVKHRIAAGENVLDNPSLRPWERLAAPLQYSNRNTAAQIRRRLATVGYVIISSDADLPQVSPMQFAQHHEPLAQLGHICWMNERLAAGWVYASGPKDFTQKTHPCLVPWIDLPKVEQDKERQQIRDVPAILAEAGLRIAIRPSRINSLPDFSPIPE